MYRQFSSSQHPPLSVTFHAICSSEAGCVLRVRPDDSEVGPTDFLTFSCHRKINTIWRRMGGNDSQRKYRSSRKRCAKKLLFDLCGVTRNNKSSYCCCLLALPPVALFTKLFPFTSVALSRRNGRTSDIFAVIPLYIHTTLEDGPVGSRGICLTRSPASSPAPGAGPGHVRVLGRRWVPVLAKCSTDRHPCTAPALSKIDARASKRHIDTARLLGSCPTAFCSPTFRSD